MQQQMMHEFFVLTYLEAEGLERQQNKVQPKNAPRLLDFSSGRRSA